MFNSHYQDSSQKYISQAVHYTQFGLIKVCVCVCVCSVICLGYLGLLFSHGNFYQGPELGDRITGYGRGQVSDLIQTISNPHLMEVQWL